MHDETESRTGATPEQIARATLHAHIRMQGTSAYDPNGPVATSIRDMLTGWAQDLVPPTHRIVPATDVLTPELRAAIYLVCRFIADQPFETTPCEVVAAADLMSHAGSSTDSDYGAFLDATGRYEGQLT